jgi:hypothetical protein
MQHPHYIGSTSQQLHVFSRVTIEQIWTPTCKSDLLHLCLLLKCSPTGALAASTAILTRCPPKQHAKYPYCKECVNMVEVCRYLVTFTQWSKGMDQG